MLKVAFCMEMIACIQRHIIDYVRGHRSLDVISQPSRIRLGKKAI